MIGFEEALRLTLKKVQPLGTERIALSQAAARQLSIFNLQFSTSQTFELANVQTC
jgi:hypothetical protein